MKEIGDSFKKARETIGISKDAVIKDLNITESQLDNLEDGNINAFKDVFFLKEIIKKYTKYLNLDEEKIMDNFNDFMFGYTYCFSSFFKTISYFLHEFSPIF